MRFTPAAARAATVNDSPLTPSMKIEGLADGRTHGTHRAEVRQFRRNQRLGTSRFVGFQPLDLSSRLARPRRKRIQWVHLRDDWRMNRWPQHGRARAS